MRHTAMMDDITDFVFVEHAPCECDIIFLPGGSDPAPPEKAAELYRAGYAQLLLPSGGVSVKTGKFGGVKREKGIYNGLYRTDCEFYTDVLVKNRVPDSAILGEDQSGYTLQNAQFSRRVADGRGLAIRSAIVCCKAFHARRCLMAYQLAFPEAEIRIIPVEVYDINRDNWYLSPYGIERVMGELTRCGSQFVDGLKACLGAEA